MGWVRRHPRWSALLCLFFVMLFFTFLIDRAAGNRLQRQLSAIKARGEPISAQDLNDAMINLPIAKNPAFIALKRAAFLQRPCKVPEEIRGHLPEIGNAKWDVTGIPLSAGQVESLQWFFESKVDDVYLIEASAGPSSDSEFAETTLAEAVVDIEAALNMPGGRYQVMVVTPAISTLFPELWKYRQVAQLLGTSCALNAELGDEPACIRDLSGIHGLARCFDGGYQMLIHGLVQVSIENQHLSWLERVINRVGLNSAYLESIQEQIEPVQDGPDWQRAMMAERAMFIDSYQWARSGTVGGFSMLAGLTAGAPGGANATANIWRYVPALPSLDVVYGLRMYSELIEATKSAGPQALKRAMQTDARTISAPAYHVFSRLMLPSLSRSVALWLRGVGSKRAMIAALASERYRLANGEWPESLTDLVPEYLKAVPADPFDGAPIRYAVTSEGIELWCIGEDLKDDGGDIKRRDKKGPNDRPTDGGWLILNPDLRGKPLPEPASAIATSSPATQSAGN